jgi:hypothetical protein
MLVRSHLWKAAAGIDPSYPVRLIYRCDWKNLLNHLRSDRRIKFLLASRLTQSRGSNQES